MGISYSFKISEVEDLIYALDNRISIVGNNPQLSNLKTYLNANLTSYKIQLEMRKKSE